MELSQCFPNNKDMQASHETIYTHLYILPKGELRKSLIGHLLQNKIEESRKISNAKRGTIAYMISIQQRPAEVEYRIIPGQMEGGISIRKDHKIVIFVIIEIAIRTVILVPLKNHDTDSIKKVLARS
jgi:IS30 family transposase